MRRREGRQAAGALPAGAADGLNGLPLLAKLRLCAHTQTQTHRRTLTDTRTQTHPPTDPPDHPPDHPTHMHTQTMLYTQIMLYSDHAAT